jgi:hypothetical protein
VAKQFYGYHFYAIFSLEKVLCLNTKILICQLGLRGWETHREHLSNYFLEIFTASVLPPYTLPGPIILSTWTANMRLKQSQVGKCLGAFWTLGRTSFRVPHVDVVRAAVFFFIKTTWSTQNMGKGFFSLLPYEHSYAISDGNAMQMSWNTHNIWTVIIIMWLIGRAPSVPDPLEFSTGSRSSDPFSRIKEQVLGAGSGSNSGSRVPCGNSVT